MIASDLLRWLPLIPLCASVFNLFFGRWLGKQLAGAVASAGGGRVFCAGVLSILANGVDGDLARQRLYLDPSPVRFKSIFPSKSTR